MIDGLNLMRCACAVDIMLWLAVGYVAMHALVLVPPVLEGEIAHMRLCKDVLRSSLLPMLMQGLYDDLRDNYNW